MHYPSRRFSTAPLSVVILLVVGCGEGGTGGNQPAADSAELKKCTEDLSTAKSDLGKCEDSLSTAKSGLGECESSLSSARSGLTDAQAKLKVFTESPAGAYQQIASKADEAETVAEVDLILADIEKFESRFPGAPEGKALKKLVPKLNSARKGFEKTEAEAKALEAIKEVRDKLSTVQDGTEMAIPQAVAVGDYLRDNGIKFEEISKLPSTNHAEAMKDPSAERGRAILASGRVVQIDRDGTYFKGIICQGTFCDKTYYFVTPGETRGIVEDKLVKFAGIMSQKYSYANVSGGQTHSIMLVGYFKGQN